MGEMQISRVSESRNLVSFARMILDRIPVLADAVTAHSGLRSIFSLQGSRLATLLECTLDRVECEQTESRRESVELQYSYTARTVRYYCVLRYVLPVHVRGP